MNERDDYWKEIEERTGLSCAVCSGYGCAFCPAVRRQELVDRLEEERVAGWDGEAGTVSVRLLCAVAVLAAVVLVVVVAWHWIVGAGVIFTAWRVLTRHTRRRRARSSWSSMGRTAAAMYAAWNTRGLVRRNGRPLRVSVPASAGREHRDEYGDIPF